MARIWMSGLEAGHMDVFDSYDVGNASASADTARTGAYSLKLATVLAWAAAAFPANVSEVFCRFAVRPWYGLYGANGNELLTLYDSVGDEQITIQLQQILGLIQVRRGDYNDPIIGIGGVLPQNRWHCVEFHLLVDGVNGVFQLKVDGTQVINFAGNTQATANANVRSFKMGFQVSCCSGYYDDIAFNDVAGGVNDSWIGRGGIPAIFPEGAGNSTDLTPLVGANWQDVDEKPPDDDTTYVFSDTIDEHDSYETEDLPATGTISAVQWLARARSDLVGNPEIARILRIGGVDYQGADIGIDIAYDYYPEILDEDPDAAGAWTVAAVNGMELGVKIR